MSRTKRFVLDFIYAFLGIIAFTPLSCGFLVNVLIGIMAIYIGRFIFR